MTKGTEVAHCIKAEAVTSLLRYKGEVKSTVHACRPVINAEKGSCGVRGAREAGGQRVGCVFAHLLRRLILGLECVEWVKRVGEEERGTITQKRRLPRPGEEEEEREARAPAAHDHE